MTRVVEECSTETVANLDRLGRAFPAAPQIMADLQHASVSVHATSHETRQ